ncbi:MAG: HAMP domain-containing histidine kinase [Actinomycetota bacterium]|nr:HAMP domain-containing histidine kinase [Actinomycetota bacterium]
MNAPIRARLTALYVLLLAAIVGALIAFVVTRLRADLTAELDRTLRAATAQIARGYRVDGPAEFRDTARTALPGTRRESAGAQVIDPTGRVLFSEGTADSQTALIDRDARTRALGGRTVAISRRIGRPVRHLRILAVPARRDGRREVLVVFESLHETDDAVHRVFVLLLIGGGAALALVALGGWWIARRALRPVERMTVRAEQIGIDNLAQRIAVPAVNDEVAHLARTLNAMLERLQDGVRTRQQLLDRLEENVQARQRLVADASHELRAPLAAMRAELEVSLRQDRLDPPARAALQLARDDAVRLGRIVDNLLTLARVDEGRLELLTGTHDLRDLAQRAARAHRATAAVRQIEVALEGEAGDIEVDGDRIEQVLSNLLDNAIRHAPNDGHVSLRLRRQAAEAVISVSDDGLGIPRDQRERVFERFTRQDAARGRGGAGLGLAICREIVDAHHGRIWIEDQPPRGTTVLVALPATGPTSP